MTKEQIINICKNQITESKKQAYNDKKELLERKEYMVASDVATFVSAGILHIDENTSIENKFNEIRDYFIRQQRTAIKNKNYKDAYLWGVFIEKLKELAIKCELGEMK